MEEATGPTVATIRAMWFSNLTKHVGLDAFDTGLLLTFRALDRFLEWLKTDIAVWNCRHFVCVFTQIKIIDQFLYVNRCNHLMVKH